MTFTQFLAATRHFRAIGIAAEPAQSGRTSARKREQIIIEMECLPAYELPGIQPPTRIRIVRREPMAIQKPAHAGKHDVVQVKNPRSDRAAGTVVLPTPRGTPQNRPVVDT